ncbi:MAG: ATP-binding cassette domain-containing protein [Ruminococcus sp.]|nr:ATP-binding cassette domain-containing protein [Ruminococcus sp.]
MREIVVRTNKLTKKYKNCTALDAADMTVYREDIYGLIGRNGAGKTTIMKLLTGLTYKTSGEFELFGKTGAEAANEVRRIGSLIENPAFFGNLTAYQNLCYYSCQKGITDRGQIDEALKMVGLTENKNKKFRKFSLGMKQRLGIAFAMLDAPDLMILDEPINGLDPIAISELRTTFRKLNTERGITLIISSHILSELYAVANRFLFIDNGKVIKEATKQELDLECSRCIVLRSENIKRAVTVIEDKLGLSDYKVIDNRELRIYEENVRPDIVNRTLINNDVDVWEIFESGVSLEDYFKKLVGEGA